MSEIKVKDMKKTTARCKKCGYWDMAMKYGDPNACSRCGTPLKVTQLKNDKPKLNVIYHIA